MEYCSFPRVPQAQGDMSSSTSPALPKNTVYVDISNCNNILLEAGDLA